MLVQCSANSVFHQRSPFWQHSGASMRTHSQGQFHPVEGDMSWRVAMLRAGEQYKRCKEVAKGRYWAGEIRVAPNATLHIASDGTTELNSPLSEDGRGCMTGFGCLGWSAFSIGMCMPAQCSQASTRAAILTAFQNLKILSPPDLSFLRQEKQRRAVFLIASELADWSDFRISWAVLGFPGCGTSSLMANLRHHAELEVLHVEERVFEDDAYFLSRVQHPLYLPFLPEVVRFNSWRTKDSRGVAMLRGIKYTGYIDSEIALHRLSQIRDFRAIVLVHDPVSLAERMYLKNFGNCRELGVVLETPPLGECIEEDCGPICPFNTTPASMPTKRFRLDRQDFIVSQRIWAAAGDLGPGRIFLTDRGNLAHGHSFYSQVARFLGVSPASESGVRYLMANKNNKASKSTKELRKELVSDSSALRAHRSTLQKLHEYFATERANLRRLFRELPPHTAPSELLGWLHGLGDEGGNR